MSQLSSLTKQTAARTAVRLHPFWPLLAIAGAGLLITVAVVGWYATGRPATPGATQTDPPTAAATSPDAADESAARTVVTLSPQRLAEAHISTATVTRQAMRTEATVPARVTHDATRRLVVTAPVDCVVQDVLVQRGQEVSAGQRLVVLASPEVGLARDQVARSEDDLRVAQRESDNANEILENVQALLAQLAQAPDPAVVLKQFSGKRLGEHREHVLAAYSKMLVARKAVDDTGEVGSSGALSRRLVQQRQSDYEVATAAFESQRETTLFESQQQRDKAAAALAQQARLLRVAQGRLERLLGSLASQTEAEDHSPGGDLSQLVVIATQSGRIEDSVVVKHQRLTAGDEVLTIADTSVLWISANVHEQEWQATELGPGDEVSARFPALGNQQSVAKVRFVGSQVSEQTRSLPLVAEIDNAHGTLRPGMFAWVSLPLEQAQEAVVVPPSAVMRHEGQAFVFVAEGGGRFRRTNVKLGREQSDEVEVIQGLSGGEQIAVSNTFLLKSELLLEDEE